MKKTLSLRRLFRLSGFTLVELLVVIGIIAILAGVLLSVFPTVIKAAKRAKAANMATQIQTACLGYFTEYSVYPVPSTVAAGTDWTIADSSSTDGSNWGNLICVLCGNIHPSSPATPFTPTTITNTRNIAFLNLKASDVGSSGSGQDAPLNPLPSSTTANIYFNIAMNSSYSGVLGTTSPSTVMPNFGTSSGSTTTTTGGTSTAGVAVWANCNGSTTLNNPAFWVHTY